jgi:sugar-specific transcriptional regulator TrmB/DNA-binding CsgD family transcriptional regulator
MTISTDERRPILIPDAHDCYLAILSGERTDPPPSPEVRQLLDVNLIAPDSRRPGHYQALDVEAAIRTWQTSLQTMAGTLLQEAQTVGVQLRDLSTAWRLARPGHAPTPGVEQVVGYETINARIDALTAESTTEIMTAHPTGPRPPHMLARSYGPVLTNLRRGVSVRTIYLPSVRTDDATARWAQTVIEQGAQIRTSSNFGRAIIVDHHIVVTSVLTPWAGSGSAPDRALFVTDPDLVGHFVAGFERDWNRAEPWDGVDQGVTPTDLQQQILKRLACGMEQLEIADELHVSLRTVAARIAELREQTRSRNMNQLMNWFGKHGSHS